MSSGKDKRDTSTAANASAQSPKVGSRGTGSRGKDARGSAGKVQGKDRDMGAALRSVYQHTVDESVPDEMLDLLGKLD